MHSPPELLRFGMVALICAALHLPTMAADDPVEIRLTNGDRLTAAIDPRTDRDRLRLTTSLDRGSLTQSIPWSHVEQVEIAGHRFEGRVVRAAVATLLDAASDGTMEAPPNGLTLLDSSVLNTETGSRPPSANTRPVPYTLPKPQAMTVSAGMGNWDADVGVDGLVVEVTPLDSTGAPVGCNGSVEFLLRTWKTSGRDRRLTMVSERWSERLGTGDSDAGSMLFRLPFRVVEPQQNSDWWPRGVLQVRLIVAGSPVIERSLTDLRIRPFEPLRDHLEQQTGRRYFPGENEPHGVWHPTRR